MKMPSNFFAVAATLVAVLTLPAAASAAYLIPDGNSAVNQYTEGIPTGGGERDAKGAGEETVRPAETIGARTTRQLEQKGPEGTALAEVAAETAPPTTAPSKQSAGDGKELGDSEPRPADGSGQGSEEAGTALAVSGDGPNGSSGLGSVLTAATGGSSNGLGLLLPLTIVGALAWGVAFAWSRRGHDRSAPSRS